MAIRKFNISELVWLDKKNKNMDIIKEIDVQLSSEHITQKASIYLHESNQASIVLKEPTSLNSLIWQTNCQCCLKIFSASKSKSASEW